MIIRTFIVILFIGFIFSCREKQTANVPLQNQPSVMVKEVLVSSQNCIPDSSKCSYVRIKYPEFSKMSKSELNHVIVEKVKVVASDYFNENTPEVTLEQIAESFIKDFEEFKADNQDYEFGWYLELLAEVIHESEQVVSLRIYNESFTGGAHANSSTVYSVIDLKSMKELSLTEIISDTVKFKELLESEFRKVKGLGENQSFADIGYFIDDEDFILNSNIGLSDESVIVHFNPYEIAPYSEGATTLELNRSDLGAILMVK